MRKLLVVVCSLIVLFGSWNSFAQSNVGSTTEGATESVNANAGNRVESDFQSEREELLVLLQLIEDAINNKDIAAIEAHVRPSSIMIFQDATVALGYKALLAYFDRMLGASESLLTGMSLSAEVFAPAEFYGENTAIAHGYIDANYVLRGGKSFDMRTLWTTTVVKESDVWTIASLHFSNNVIDNPILNASKRFSWILGVSGLIFGMVLVWLLGRFNKKRQKIKAV